MLDVRALCPAAQLLITDAALPAGIGYSDDKLLQTRIFSYADTQRHRLGPNYLMLPANAPKCAHHNNHHDGFMNFMHRDEEARPPPSAPAALATRAGSARLRSSMRGVCAQRCAFISQVVCFCNAQCGCRV